MTPQQLAHRVSELERPLLVGLDVDGTLAPIVEDPAAAEIPQGTLDSIQRLTQNEATVVALISGREVAALARMAPLEGLWIAAEHGAVVLAPQQVEADVSTSAATNRALRSFAAWASRLSPELYIETKPRSVAIHVRKLASSNAEEAMHLLRQAEDEALRLGLEPRRGRAVFEACAVATDKGSALREITERCGAHGVFYAGDDLTDFEAITFAARHGIGVFVRSREQAAPEEASLTLDGPEAVAELLHHLADLLN